MKTAIVAMIITLLGARVASAQQPALSPPPPPGGDADETAKLNIAVLQKFVHDHLEDPEFAQYERHKHCRVDRDREVVTLTFNADGTLHCKLDELAEGYRIDVWVLTLKEKAYTEDGHYTVTAVAGDRLKSLVHGTADDVNTVVAVLKGKTAAGAPTPAWWHAKQLLGPYRNANVTLTIKLDEAGVSTDTKLSITPLYIFNLAVVALGGPATKAYSIVDSVIASNSSKFDLNYYFGIHAYPFSWSHNGDGNIRPGRYFSRAYEEWTSRLSVVLGVNVTDPKNGGYIGGAIELFDGFAITGGWQPRKIDVLQSGKTVGMMTDDKDAPTESKWDVGNWGIGVTFDASAVLPVASIFK